MTKLASAALALAVLASSARADLRVTNDLQDDKAGVWVTIYDVARNVKFGTGCVGPNSFKDFSHPSFATTFKLQAYVLRVEVTPDSACKGTPVLCDTTAHVAGNSDVQVLKNGPSAARCFLQVHGGDDAANEQAERDARAAKQKEEAMIEANKELPECVTQLKLDYAAAKQLFDKLVATGKAPPKVTQLSSEFPPIKKTSEMITKQWVGDSVAKLSDCSRASNRVSWINAQMAPSVGLLTAPGKPVSSLMARLHVITSAVQASKSQLAGCVKKAGVFKAVSFAPTTTAGVALESQLLAKENEVSKDTRTDEKSFKAAEADIDGLEKQGEKFTADVEKACGK